MALFLTALISAGVTAVITILVFNFWPEEQIIRYEITTDYGVDDEQFRRAMGQLLPPPLMTGNRVDILVNGDEFFPAMFEAVRNARHSICFEIYIYWSGETGLRWAEALAERARAGVKVHVLLDWVGSFKMDEDSLKLMEEAGVEIEKFHPLGWYNISRFNNRTHRKILVVDGKIGFTGGAGIADEWTGNATEEDRYRDYQFRLEGPAVAEMQAAFMDNWLRTHNKVLHQEAYFPSLEDQGDKLAQVFKSGPHEGSESARLMFLYSIACAERQVLIANSYFVPDDLAVKTLVDARKRGVDVQIMVPGRRDDTVVTQHASRSRWGALLEAGIEMYRFMPTLFHCKTMVVDGLWSTVGSSNFDSRSFRLNDEVNLNVFDKDFAQGLIEQFENDKKRCEPITLEEWENRPWQEKAKDSIAGLFRSQF